MSLSASHAASPETVRTTLPFTLENLTGPRPALSPSDQLKATLSGQTVLVTGAAGSIGSALSTDLAALTPERLVLVDIDEHGLYQLRRWFSERPGSERPLSEQYDTAERDAQKHGAQQRDAGHYPSIECRLADVSDLASVERLFRQVRPDLVIHAAACKHVPITERHPCRAFRVNTLSAVYLAQACQRHDTRQLIVVSTDKAARPQNVLGATKRLAEWHVLSATLPGASKAIRFGNVFGSRGSVLPLFEEQLARGQPLTVTHPEMERYFMSMREACVLSLETLRLTSHLTYVFRMGPPVSIRRLAERLICHRLGPEALATGDGRIRYTGVRPGEAIREHLCGHGESLAPTAHPHISGVEATGRPRTGDIACWIRRLREAFRDPQIRPDAARALLFDAVAALTSRTRAPAEAPTSPSCP